MADISQLVISVDSKGVMTATGNLELLNKAGKKTEKTTETLDQSAKKLTKQFELQARNAGKSANEIKMLDLKAKGATKAQLDAAQAAMKNAEAMKKQADAARFAAQSAGETGGPFRAMRGSMQQVSWQLQDVAVQAQMGTSAFTILGQQGPQIASIFGPGGAVVGALVAFGAMVGGVLYNSLTGASELTKELTKATEDLFEQTDELNGALKELAMLQAAKRQKELEKAIVQATEAMETSEVVIRSVALGAVVMDSTLKKANDTITEQKGIIAATKIELGLLAKQTDGMTDSTESLLLDLHEENILLNATKSQIIAYKAAMAGATQEQVNFAVKLYEETEAQEVAKKAREDAIEAQKKATETSQNYTISLNNQLVLLNLSGDALFLYQASLKGGTMAEIEANAALLKSIALRKEKIKADADAEKAKVKADADAVKAQEKADAAALKAQAKADADALKAGDQAQKLMQEIEQANMTELQQLEAQLTAKGGLLLQFLAQDHITLDQYLAMDAELQATYRTAEELAIAESNQKKLESDKAYADAKASLDQQVLSSASALVGDLANAAEEGSGAQKALFAIQKAIAIATAIVNTELAAATALAPPPLGLGPIAGAGYAQVIRAMGYASVGIMAGTAIAGGRALGGQVRGGESYLVGERGPELLTMGTSGRVTSNDSLKNAINSDNSNTSNVVNVNFAIQANDTAGFDRLLQSRRGQIVGMINQAVNNRGRASIV